MSTSCTRFLHASKGTRACTWRSQSGRRRCSSEASRHKGQGTARLPWPSSPASSVWRRSRRPSPTWRTASSFLTQANDLAQFSASLLAAARSDSSAASMPESYPSVALSPMVSSGVSPFSAISFSLASILSMSFTALKKADVSLRLSVRVFAMSVDFLFRCSRQYWMPMSPAKRSYPA